MQSSSLFRGDPAPWFVARRTADPAAGRYVVLCFLGSVGESHPQSLGLSH